MSNVISMRHKKTRITLVFFIGYSPSCFQSI
nr:MAG TPA: hypothetical protein [Caudoviricetes sp.]